MKLSLREMILAGIFAALTAVCAQISIPLPVSPVPLTLSIFAVFLSGIILGSKYGTLSQIVYVLIGAIGVPVFSGFHGGFDVIASYKGGYIISYPIMALVIGIIIEHKKNVSITDMIGTMVIGLIICYTLGAGWLSIITKSDIKTAISMGVAPFLPLDILKIIIAAILGDRVRKALIKANLLKV